jgi:hypothetical protein
MLLVVDDQWNGLYYEFQLERDRGPVIDLSADRLTQIRLPHANLATDLEAIDVLADGRIVVLSERLRALFSADGVLTDYDAALSEFGKRGLEGLAVRRLSDDCSGGGRSVGRGLSRVPGPARTIEPSCRTHGSRPLGTDSPFEARLVGDLGSRA